MPEITLAEIESTVATALEAHGAAPGVAASVARAVRVAEAKGWPEVEGTAPFDGAGPPRENYVAPIHEYGRSDGCSVTGGYVYRGQAIPELFGQYVFGDYCTSRLWGLASSRSQGPLGRYDIGGGSLPGESLASFGEGPDGELYVLSFEGRLYRIDPAA